MIRILFAGIVMLCCYGCTSRGELNLPEGMLHEYNSYIPTTYNETGQHGGDTITSQTPNTIVEQECPTQVRIGDICITTPGYGGL